MRRRHDARAPEGRVSVPRRRTPTLLTPLGARGLAAVDRIEVAGWKLGALQETPDGWRGTISREGRTIGLCAASADQCAEELAELLQHDASQLHRAD